MRGLDWVILGIMALSVMTAFLQGFWFEVFSLAGVVAGYLLAAWEYPRLSLRFQSWLKETWVADLVAFLAIFFAVLLVAGLAGRLARWVMRKAGLSWVDRFLGGAFGLARGAITACVLVLALAAFAPGSRWLAGSELSAYFLAVAQGLTWMAPATVREKVRTGSDVLRRASGEAHGTQARP